MILDGRPQGRSRCGEQWAGADRPGVRGPASTPEAATGDVPVVPVAPLWRIPVPDDARPMVARISAPEHLLTFMPYVMGYVPELCLQVALFDQKGSLAVAQLDLSGHVPTTSALDQIWESVTETITHVEAEVASLLLYGGADLVEPVLATTHRAPVPLNHVLRVEEQHYWDLRAPEDLRDIGIPWKPDPQIQDMLRSAGWSDAPSHRDYLDKVRPGRDRAVATRVEQTLEEVVPPTPAAAFRLIESIHRARATASDPSDSRCRLNPVKAARILLGLRNDTVRCACLGWHEPHALNLWMDLLAITPPQQAAPLLGLTSVCAYFRGDGERAREAATAALALDPDQLEATLTSNGLLALPGRPTDVAGFIHLAATNARHKLIDNA